MNEAAPAAQAEVHFPTQQGKFGAPPRNGFDVTVYRSENSLYDCEVEGDIPDDLDGGFYRVRYTGKPVYIADGVTCEGATIGPNASIGAGTEIRWSTIRNTIVGEKSSIAGSTLEGSMIGDHAVVEGVHGSLTLGDHGEVRARG